jgi:hypothetical protein
MATKKPQTPESSSTSEMTARESILNPQAYVTRKVFSLSATVPVEPYVNFTPHLEVEYIIPEGAEEPENAIVLQDFMLDLSYAMHPQVIAQTNKIPLRANPTASIGELVQMVETAFVAGSPLFKWLTIANASLATQIVHTRLEAAEKARKAAASAAK